MKRLMLLAIFPVIIFGCKSNVSDDTSKTGSSVDSTGEKIPNPGGSSSYDSSRGVGKFTNVDVKEKLDVAMAAGGEKTYEVKCSPCHKLTDEKLVGPGWKGVTTRHKPEWIMNFVTNTEEMLNKDSKAQAELEICLVRMPKQNLTDNEARQLLEYMRKNDGVK